MVELHPRLQQDTCPVGETPLCWIRYMNDQRFPWIIVVPRVEGISEWHELRSDQQQELLALVNCCAENIKQIAGVDKINIGALGNLVPQLHVHVIGRRTNDPCWPAPVWGNGEPLPWPQGDSPQWLQPLKDALGESCA